MQKALVIWYVESDWPEWLKIDPNFLPTYREWLTRTQAELPKYRDMGLTPEPVTVRVKDFKRWAAANNKPRRQESVSAYVMEQVNRNTGAQYRRT